MTRDQQFSILAAALLLAANSANAATVTKTTTAAITISGSGSYTTPVSQDFTFSDITNADALVSVSGGTASGFEGGSFSVSVDYQGGGSQELFSRNLSPVPYSLSNIANVPFVQGTINGLTFKINAFADSLSIPIGTQFTFHTVDPAPSVPEPATWATFLLGFGAVGGAMRMRGRKKLATA